MQAVAAWPGCGRLAAHSSPGAGRRPGSRAGAGARPWCRLFETWLPGDCLCTCLCTFLRAFPGTSLPEDHGHLPRGLPPVRLINIPSTRSHAYLVTARIKLCWPEHIGTAYQSSRNLAGKIGLHLQATKHPTHYPPPPTCLGYVEIPVQAFMNSKYLISL
ncbi:hypothetical protein DFH06DRAFT_286762 [Mycena polygramma]|nr:hypothetical protein DFH06DRAFT_286762 [Mycena polygramma]